MISQTTHTLNLRDGVALEERAKRALPETTTELQLLGQDPPSLPQETTDAATKTTDEALFFASLDADDPSVDTEAMFLLGETSSNALCLVPSPPRPVSGHCLDIASTINPPSRSLSLTVESSAMDVDQGPTPILSKIVSTTSNVEGTATSSVHPSDNVWYPSSCGEVPVHPS